jgi:trigger factor
VKMGSEIRKSLRVDEELIKTYEIAIGASFINSKVEETTKEKQKTYKMNGFRPGKVPLDVIRKKEGTVLFFSTAEDIINTEVFNIVKENNYELVSDPNIEIKTMELDTDVVVNAEYTLFPTIPAIDLKTVKIKEYSLKVDELDIEQTIDSLMKNFKDWVDKDGEVATGDTVKINFVGRIDGEAFDGGKGEDYPLEIGTHSFVDNFEEQLIGKKAGDKVLVKVTFPSDYHSSKLAGKQAEFDVEILKVMSPKEPTLDDDFVMKNFALETVESLKNIVKKEIETSNEATLKTKTRSEVVEKISEILEFNVPQNLIEKRFQETLKSVQKSNLENKKEEEIDEGELRKEAENAVRLGLFLSKIAREQNIAVSKSEVESTIIKNAMRMKGYEQAFMDFYRKNPQLMGNIRAEILENKIIDYVISSALKESIVVSVADIGKL